MISQLLLLSTGALASLTCILIWSPGSLGDYYERRSHTFLVIFSILLLTKILALVFMLVGPLEQSLLSTTESNRSSDVVCACAPGIACCCELVSPELADGRLIEGEPHSAHTTGVPPLRLQWDCISYDADRRTRVLAPCSGSLDGGIWCLIGPSGAGKSTLLGVLAGRKATGIINGHVYLNGRAARASVRRMLLGYVTQDDILPGTSTPAEHLFFHAALRLSWLSSTARSEAVHAALASLHLSALAHRPIGDAYVRGLSGGERRRVSVAIELLVLAAGGSGMLLMDEPLSGLDSVNARLLMDALLEAEGETSFTWSEWSVSEAAGSAMPKRTVLMSVHQPSTRFINKTAGVVVMGDGGRLLYCGPRWRSDGGCSLTAFFDGAGVCLRPLSHNPAEAIIEAMVDSQLAARLAAIATQQSTMAERNRCPAAAGPLAQREWRVRAFGPGIATQLLALCARQARLATRHPLLISINLVSTLLVAVVSGALFFQLNLDLNTGVLMRVGMVFFLGLYFTLTALVGLSLWAEERALYFQESGAGCYGPVSYILSRTLFDALLMRVLPTVFCVAILYPMAGLSSDRPSSPIHAALFAGGLCLCNLVGTTVVNTFGIGCQSGAVASLISVSFALFSMLFSGFLVNLPAIEQRGASWLRFGSSLFYLNELLLSDELLHQTITVDATLPKIHGEEVLAQLGYSLNCSRVGGLSDTACWYVMCVPAIAISCCLLVSVLLLRFCIKDPH